MKALAIIQARTGSSRLPGKVLLPLSGRPLITHVVERVRRARGVGEVVVAVPRGDMALMDCCAAHDTPCHEGSEEDVLDRFYQAAQAFPGEPLLRITADCPCVEPTVIDELLALHRTGDYAFAAVNTGVGAVSGPRWPDGLDAEFLTRRALRTAWTEARTPFDREHVTPFIWRQPERFHQAHLKAPRDLGHLRLTVDTQKDYRLVSILYDALYAPDRPFTLDEALSFLEGRGISI